MLRYTVTVAPERDDFRWVVDDAAPEPRVLFSGVARSDHEALRAAASALHHLAEQLVPPPPPTTDPNEILLELIRHLKGQ